MPRPAKFTEEQILDAACLCVGTYGNATTIAQVAETLGAPVGSLYYRFASRETMMISLWLRSVQQFHAGLFAAAEIEDPRQALVAAALHVPRFCRDRPAVARALTLYRQPAALAAAPAAIRAEVATVNDPLVALEAGLIRRGWGRVTPTRSRLVLIAVRQSPYGLVRPYVGGEVPLWLDEVVAAATGGILDLVR